MCVSSNGQYLIASGNDVNSSNILLASTNYGTSWDFVDSSPNVSLNSICISANGQYITGCVYGGFLYNSVTPYINMSISNNLIVYNDVSFNNRLFLGGPVFQF